MRARLIFVVIMVLTTGGLIRGQNSVQSLRQSREKMLQEIDYATKLLLETQGKTKESLQEINLINHRLTKRKAYLMGLELEVSVLNEAIENNQMVIFSLESQIVKLKKVYAHMVRNLYRNKVSQFRLMYFLASDNMNQLYKRIKTVRFYTNYLRSERLKLEDAKSKIRIQNDELERLRSSKDLLLNKAKEETVSIQREVNQKAKIVKQLKQKQQEIEEDIRNKEKIAKKLENELKKIIDTERKKAKASSGAADRLTPQEMIISTDFEKNTGRLPWPAERGIITGEYGEHKHPDYKNITVRNDGVYISTMTGEHARSIFKGVVSRVFTIPGENFTVIVKHGKYYSLYHNLVNIQVKAGQEVNTKQYIGTIFTDKESKETILYFQIWKETERNNPEIWLAPKN